MMYAEVLSKITDVYNRMTKSEKKIADYMLQKRGDPQFMSITTFAQECKVADGTVFRFCQTLGYRGYNDFKLALAQAHGHEQPNNFQPDIDEDVYRSLSIDDSPETTGKKLLALYTAALHQTATLLDNSEVVRAAHMLQNANHIYCLGNGGSQIIAMEAWVRFLTVSKKFETIQDTHLQVIGSALLSEEDVIWCFSYSGATKDMMDILGAARARKAKVILVTRYIDSPAARFANVILICGSNESPMQSGALVAKISQLYVIDMVYQEYLKLDPAECEANRNATAAVIAHRLL
ncbi:MAG: MurR/RpiR family transcriptional regulator [Gemmiger sp.]|nr:MurR/RpiR family transcriptional regulator [Gemmiger sp.]